MIIQIETIYEVRKFWLLLADSNSILVWFCNVKYIVLLYCGYQDLHSIHLQSAFFRLFKNINHLIW